MHATWTHNQLEEGRKAEERKNHIAKAEKLEHILKFNFILTSTASGANVESTGRRKSTFSSSLPSTFSNQLEMASINNENFHTFIMCTGWNTKQGMGLKSRLRGGRRIISDLQFSHIHISKCLGLSETINYRNFIFLSTFSWGSTKTIKSRWFSIAINSPARSIVVITAFHAQPFQHTNILHTLSPSHRIFITSFEGRAMIEPVGNLSRSAFQWESLIISCEDLGIPRAFSSENAPLALADRTR